MCRLVAYLGHSVLLEDVLVKPINSIIMQSLHARESNIPTNGDGFGLGWYNPEINHLPALFTSISPAWNDRNLLYLTAKIKSPCFFAHVRAAGMGGVSTYNCHPFIHGKWMLMHNGDIANSIAVKRHLRRLLDDDIYNWIQGETDSEHLFALFLQFAKGRNLDDLFVLGDTLRDTIYQINQLVHEHGGDDSSIFNICLTDGLRLVATRYASDKTAIPESMHYYAGKVFNTQKIHQEGNENTRCILIASEKLTEFQDEWKDVPAQHMLLVDEPHGIQIRAL